ncbi:MAG: MMPL family transporter [Corynebacterium sp.]|nr:MMPL family transporter [Corynebacterium sp.]
MAQFLYRLGRGAYSHAGRFIAVWLILLGLFGIGANQLAKPVSDSFSIPGLSSIETQQKLAEVFDTGDLTNAPTGTIVLKSTDGKPLSDEEHMAQMQTLIEELKASGELVDTDTLYDPVTTAAGMAQQLTAAKSQQGLSAEQIDSDIAALSPLSADGMTGTISITLNADSGTDVTAEQREAVTSIIESAATDNLEVAYTGTGLINQVPEQGAAELVGLIVAAIVLMVTFGSLVAAGMPLITAVVGVGIGLLGIQIATHFSDAISSTTSTLASMIGLAVGIDYALFIASRFRSEIIEKLGISDATPKELRAAMSTMSKADRAHAMGMAVGKAGSAVVFAGSTVVIALVALLVVNIPFLSSMALAAAATVVVAVLVALSLLPAILSLLGVRVFGGNWIPVKAPNPTAAKATMGTRWAQFLRRNPIKMTVASVLLLAIIAIPAMNLKLAMPTDGSANKGAPNRIAYEMVEEGFGPGRNAPMIALVDNSNVQDLATRGANALQAVTMFNATEGVQNAQIVNATEDQSYIQILVTPTSGATDEETATTLQTIRDEQGEYETSTGSSFGITGVTPIYEDISDRLAEALIPYIAIVLVLAFLVLMVVFRSIWVPLIAALGFALSMAAAFGATVAIFQEGWLGLVDDPQPLVSFLPIFLIGLVFGLAMDYEVFLVSRMREEFSHGHSAHHAAEMGVKFGARVVTAAALIMASVFFAFMGMDMLLIKTMGFALGIAVLFDAFVVRMTLIPATMYLLGDRAWKIPHWLKLPKIDIEGESLNSLELKA